MSEYIKVFDTHEDYLDYKPEVVRPNVSYCKIENEVHYNPIIQPLPTALGYFTPNEEQNNEFISNGEGGIERNIILNYDTSGTLDNRYTKSINDGIYLMSKTKDFHNTKFTFTGDINPAQTQKYEWKLRVMIVDQTPDNNNNLRSRRNQFALERYDDNEGSWVQYKYNQGEYIITQDGQDAWYIDLDYGSTYNTSIGWNVRSLVDEPSEHDNIYYYASIICNVL